MGEGSGIRVLGTTSATAGLSFRALTSLAGTVADTASIRVYLWMSLAPAWARVCRSGAWACRTVALRASISAFVAGVEVAWFLRTMMTELVALAARALAAAWLRTALGDAALLAATTIRLITISNDALAPLTQRSFRPRTPPPPHPDFIRTRPCCRLHP